MLKRTLQELDDLDEQYPDIKDTILNIEDRDLPSCPSCGSDDTASIQVGVIGRTIAIASSTTKIKLVPTGELSDLYHCNNCNKSFG